MSEVKWVKLACDVPHLCQFIPVQAWIEIKKSSKLCFVMILTDRK